MLLESCFNLHLELAKLKKTIESFGWGLFGLSGSGSAMYSILDNFNKAKTIRFQNKIMKETGCYSVFVNNNGW